MPVHAAILILFALLVVQPELSQFERLSMKVDDRAIVPPLDTFELPELTEPQSDDSATSDLTIDRQSIAERLELTPATQSLDDLELDETAAAFASTELLEGVADSMATQLRLVGSRRDERPMFEGRTGPLRVELLKKYGGTKETQEAVDRGLQWLVRNQLPDGTWSLKGPYSNGGLSENAAAATAMALLAFLGDGHTHKNGKYAPQVSKAIEVVIAAQRPDGFFGSPVQGDVKILSEVQRMYGQALASLAICEAYGMTGDSRLRPYVERAIDFAVEAQASNGGWRYRPKMQGDMSVTGWYVVLLESAKSAGIEFDESVLDQVDRFLNSVSAYRGSAYAYRPGEAPRPSMTAVGLLCRQYRGWSYDNPALRRGIENMVQQMPFSVADRNVYYWYYATQVLHHDGGPAWEMWNGAMREQLPGTQVRRGPEDGSWNPIANDLDGRVGGRIYATCLSIYCLEVYYRHMPIYKPIDDDSDEAFPL